MMLTGMRGSALALAAACMAWAASCATAPQPMVDPGFAAGAYGPARVALLPPDVFVVLDQAGDNDPVRSAALGQAVSAETVRAVEQVLRSRGYDVDLSPRWDGIVAQDGTILVGRDELGWLANGILQFANGPAGGGQGPMAVPRVVAPEPAARIGSASRSDALLYVNVKGVVTTPGKRAESVLAGVFIVVIIAAIILIAVASSKGGGSSGGVPGGGGGGGWRGQPVSRAASPGGGWRGAPVSGGRAAGMPGGNVPATGGWRGTPPGSGGAAAAGGGGWRGGGAPPPVPAGAPVYRGGPGVNFGIGVGVVVPLDGPVYTHDGAVDHEDEVFAGDELYVSMTMVSTYDGRVLWHARDHLDLDADDNRDVDRMVQTFLGTLPPRPGAFAPPPQR